MENYKPEPTITQEMDEDPFELIRSHRSNSSSSSGASSPSDPLVSDVQLSEVVWGTVKRIHVEDRPGTREYVSQCIRHLSPPAPSRPLPPPGSPSGQDQDNDNQTTNSNKNPEAHAVCLIAQGRHIHKAVTCVEIIKSKKTHLELHQITRVATVKITETYEPLESMKEELEPIQVTRTIPLIHILLVAPPFNSLSPELQSCLQQHLPRPPLQSHQPHSDKQQNKSHGYQKTTGDGRKYNKKLLSMHLLL